MQARIEYSKVAQAQSNPVGGDVSERMRLKTTMIP